MTDLERFFRQIVRNLAAVDPARLRRPLPLNDIRESIVPYRANRRALELESSEDYEFVLMRLCAGEGGFARTEPDEVRAEFAREVGSPNPDLTIVHRHENAVVSLETRHLARALDSTPDLAFAPKDPVTTMEPPQPKSRGGMPGPIPEEKKAVRCTRCGCDLPVGRVANFCPQCGQSLVRRHCPECRTELEPGWRHCVSCGLPLGGR